MDTFEKNILSEVLHLFRELHVFWLVESAIEALLVGDKQTYSRFGHDSGDCEHLWIGEADLAEGVPGFEGVDLLEGHFSGAALVLPEQSVGHLTGYLIEDDDLSLQDDVEVVVFLPLVNDDAAAVSVFDPEVRYEERVVFFRELAAEVGEILEAKGLLKQVGHQPQLVGVAYGVGHPVDDGLELLLQSVVGHDARHIFHGCEVVVFAGHAVHEVIIQLTKLYYLWKILWMVDYHESSYP